MARAALCELAGVGRKVADCVLLFGYAYDGCVPVDTHCVQIAQRDLLPHIRGAHLRAPPARPLAAPSRPSRPPIRAQRCCCASCVQASR